MRNILVTSCLAFICFTSCKKDKDSTTESLTGIWELRSQYGGMIPVSPVYTPNSGNLLKFSASEYKKYVKGQLEKSGTYRLEKDSFMVGDPLVSPARYEVVHKIFYDNEPYATRLKIDGKTLIVNYGAAVVDGIEYVYKKIPGSPGF